MSHPMWVRGLKQMDVAHRRNLHQVAPYVGAWIETVFVRWGTSSRQSHPMWVRGLKHVSTPLPTAPSGSHPMWVRGLKHITELTLVYISVSHPMWVRGLKPITMVQAHWADLVAPYVGAWIETRRH